MTVGTIPVVYEEGVFRPLKPLPDRFEKQVKLYYVLEEEFDNDDLDTQTNLLEFTGELSNELAAASQMSIDERVFFVHEMAGIWYVDDEDLRRWIAEEVSLYDDGDEL